MVNITLNTKSRSCIASSTFLGYEGENSANKLIFEFMDEFVDGAAQLNIKRGNDNGYVELIKVGETYELEVKSSLVSQIGEVTFQLQVSKSDGTIYKYDTFVMTVKDAIDSDIPLPEDYPTWQEAIATALAQVENLDIFATKIDNVATISVTDKNGVITEVEIYDGEDGKDGVDGTSSEISVKTSTETEYVLTIKDKNGSFDTPNLKGKDSEGGIVNETDPVYLADKPKLALKTEIPTKTSELTNDSSFATETFVTNKIAEAELSGGDVDLSGYATKDELNKKADAEDIPTKVSELDNDSGFITDYKETDPTVPNHVKSIKSTDITNWNNKSEFSGSYNDLTDVPEVRDGKDGLTPFIGSNGNWWIGETDTGVKASGSGEGGIVGSQTVLFEGKYLISKQSVTERGFLSDNIKNYDYITLTTGQEVSSLGINLRTNTILIDTKTMYENDGTYNQWFSNTDFKLMTSNTLGYTVAGNFGDGTQIGITTFETGSSATSRNHYVTRVVGIKLGGGSGTTGGRTTTVLLDGKFTGGSGLHDLADNVSNYDTIVVEGVFGASETDNQTKNVSFIRENLDFNAKSSYAFQLAEYRGSNSYYSLLCSITDTQLWVGSLMQSGISLGYVKKVYGIKY